MPSWFDEDEARKYREARQDDQDWDKGPPPRFLPVRFREISMSTAPAYLIDGILPRDGLGVLWGSPKCGKSFWAYDAALHVALDWEYRGRRVQTGNVVYIACEGERGLGARTEAFRQGKLGDEDDHDPPFWLLTTRLDLARDVEGLIADIKAAGIETTAMIVVDTLNRSIGGSESKDEDMGAFIAAADRLREAFGGLVLIVHHCGVNGERPRGHSSLTGAVDCQLRAERSTTGKVMVDVEWLKDGSEGERIVSVLTPVTVGVSSDGSEITSCIIEEADAPEAERKPSKKPKLPAAAKIALNTLKKAISEVGEDAPASNHIPTGVRVVSVEQWRRYYQVGTASDLGPEARKKAFQRARETLQAAGAIGLHDDLCWIV